MGPNEESGVVSRREARLRYLDAYEAVECPQCHGRGTYRYPVPVNFVIRIGAERNPKMPEVYETECPMCKGERYLWEPSKK